MKLKRILTAFLTAVMLCSIPVNASAYDKYFSEDFESEDLAHSGFILGQWHFHENGGICGYADAKALQTVYDDSCGIFECPWCYRYIYLDYDATVTLTAADDGESDSDRFVNLVYVNDNPRYHGIADERIYMSFSYDFQNDCFRFTEGWNKTDDGSQILPPIYMDICDDAAEFYTLGISVKRDRIRCFYNGTLIFDYEDTAGKYFIAHDIESPFLFWQDGNYVHIKNITINRPGYLLEPAYLIGDSNSDGKINLSDVTKIMQYIAKWDVDIGILAADSDRDGKLTLSDVTLLLKYIAKWEGIVLK